MHLPFTTMGSGSLAAMGVLETKFKDNMNEQEAVDLVKDAIEAGIFHDLGSGSNVDIFVVRRDGVDKKENYRVYNKKVFTNADTYKFAPGTSPILEEIQYKWKNIEITDESSAMDIY
jgi:20S proteasome subunit beta 2